MEPLSSRQALKSVELFVGAGGLGIGLGLAGFDHELVVDWDSHSCNTIRANQATRHAAVSGWDVREGDVRDLCFYSLCNGIHLVSGGPPCQPFSLGGKHHGPLDQRDMFPEAIRAVRELAPMAFVFENVRGLRRPAFAPYLEYIKDHLCFPEIKSHDGECWLDHANRLREHRRNAGQSAGLSYDVYMSILNAANYGVPQRRERMILVGFRSDLQVEWEFPKPTHSLDALLWDQWISERYWKDHRIPANERPQLASGLRRRVERFRGFDFPPPLRPWRTVRDALQDLPDPEYFRDQCVNIPNHRHQPGARKYQGHTGSSYDEPAKVLKAGDHGVPGGENMLARQDGSCRYFSVREAARLQSFPDDYCFPGSWTESMRQIGNAVPVTLAHVLGEHIKACLVAVSKMGPISGDEGVDQYALQPVG